MSIFTTVKAQKVRKSKFDLSHHFKASTKFGQITPVLCKEIMPSDSWRCNSEVFIRLAPMLTPVMENFYANIHYFFVPNRLVWENWEDFITGGEDGTLEPVFPYKNMRDINITEYEKGTLADYLGIKVNDTPTAGWSKFVSALPFRAYDLIYNEYYRDQNLEDELVIDLTDAEDTTTPTLLQTRAWTKNSYFHSALPFAQRGAEVTLPFSDVNYKAQSEVTIVDGSPATGNLTATAGFLVTDPALQSRIENIESIGAPTINELRKAYRLQEWLENNARGGARYIEQIFSHFNQKSSDARLQRPEYLGGGRTEINISTTYNTTGIVSGTDPADGAVQGNMSGNALSLGRTNSFKRKFEEHGHVIGLLTIMSYPSTGWQGIERMWTRFDKLDFPFPEFANLGEQEIKNQEVYFAQTGATGNDDTFGYTPRYAEFKTANNQIAGDYRDNLDFWHYAQILDSHPPLNANFMKWNNDNRIFNVIDQAVDNVYVDIKHNISAIRPLPYYGTPRT